MLGEEYLVHNRIGASCQKFGDRQWEKDGGGEAGEEGREVAAHSLRPLLHAPLENLPKVRQREKNGKRSAMESVTKDWLGKIQAADKSKQQKISNLVEDEELDIQHVMAKIGGIEKNTIGDGGSTAL